MAISCVLKKSLLNIKSIQRRLWSQAFYFYSSTNNIDKFVVKGSMEMKNFANQINISLEKLHEILINAGVHEDDISTIINPSTIEHVLKQLKIPYEYHLLDKARMNHLTGDKCDLIIHHRAPIVTIIGHIDHGKTTLLDTLRKSNIAFNEIGGITQKIGAFTAYDHQKNPICFIDTPGHFAFHSSRSRGVQPADIILIIIAIDDGIQEQTIECIRLARSASLPTIIVVNKMDKVKYDSTLIQSELIKYGIVTKAMGGTVDCVEISARRGTGIDTLLKCIVENAANLDIGYDTTLKPTGFILDCKKEKQYGITSTVILRNGIISVGDFIETSTSISKVKIIMDEYGNRIKGLYPSVPAKIVGWKNEPLSGDIFEKLLNKKINKEKYRKKSKSAIGSVQWALHHANYNVQNLDQHSFIENNLQQIDNVIDSEIFKKSYSVAHPLIYKILVKADSQGSLDAVLQSLGQCQDRRIRFDLLACSIGIPTSDDLIIAKDSQSNIYCFFPNSDTIDMNTPNNTYGVNVEYHNIIYELVNSIKEHIENQLGDTVNVIMVGEAIIKKVFNFTGKVKQTVAGCEVIKGCISIAPDYNNAFCVIYDGEKTISKASINSLKQYKKSVQTINEGSECGIVFNNFKDFKENYSIKQYKIIKQKIPLEWKI